MRWEDIEKEFDFELPIDEPLLPINVVCELIDMQYHRLHELIKEGIFAEEKRSGHKKLFSIEEVKKLKYVKFLLEEKGVNINGVKVIFEIEEE